MTQQDRLRETIRFFNKEPNKCDGKTCYDKKGAQTAANLRFKNAHQKLRIYPCPQGNHWHLTSKL